MVEPVKNKQLICHLHGGLGNQLFQLVTAINLANSLNWRLLLNVERFERDYNYNRSFQLDNIFDINFNYEIIRKNRYWEKFVKIKSIFTSNYKYFENSVGELNLPIISENNTHTAILDGYWQSSRFFSDISSNLSEFMTLKVDNVSSIAMKQKNKILTERICTIHLRDFGNSLDNLSLDYYNDAILHMKMHHGIKIFYVISENKSKLLNAFKKRFCFEKIQYISGSLIDDFCLLSSSPYFIGANSTLSWWCAFIEQEKKKCIVFPKEKITGSTMEWGFSGLFEENWVLL